MVDVLTAKLAKCKSDHEQELELVRLQQANEVQELKSQIEELTNISTMKCKAYQPGT